MMAVVPSRLTHQLALTAAPLQDTHRRLLALLTWHGAGPAELHRLLPPPAQAASLPWATLASHEATLELQRSLSEFGTATPPTLLAYVAEEWQVDPNWLLGVHPRPGRTVGFLTGTPIPLEQLAGDVFERAGQHSSLVLALLTSGPGELLAASPSVLLLAARFQDPVCLPRHRVLALVDSGDPPQLSGLRELARRVAAAHPDVQLTGERIAVEKFQALITGRRHIAEIRHLAAPTRWPADELLELYQPGAAD